MKWLGIFLGVLLTILVLIYTLLFTTFGNGIVKPIIEEKINSELNTSAVLETFELDMNHFNIHLVLTPSNHVIASGDYSIFSQSVDATYKVAFEKMRELEVLLQRPSRGTIHINGTVKGDSRMMKILGESDIASSKTAYDISLESFEPSRVMATIDDAQLNELLALGGEKAYANASISLDAKLNDANPKHLDGRVTLAVKKGLVNTKLMKKDFDLTLPKTQFGVKVVTKLKDDTLEYVAKVDSNLMQVNSQGQVVLLPLNMNLNYDLNIKELALLRPITNAPLRGEFKTQGQVKGGKKALNILGTSDIGGSDTLYDITLSDFKPSKVLATIKEAKLSKLLYLIGEKNYASADINADIKLTNLDPKNLQGSLNLDVTKGFVYRDRVKKAFGVTLPKTTFSSNAKVALKGEDVDFTVGLISNLAKLSSKGTLTPETLAMNIDTTLSVANLAQLKALTGAPLQGSLKLKTSAKGNKKSLKVTGVATIAQANASFDALLKNFVPHTLHANIKDMQLSQILHMVAQPHYADGLLNINVDIPDARSGKLSGEVTTTITQGKVVTKTVEKAFEFKKMPPTTFSAKTTSLLVNNTIDTQLLFDSTLGKLQIKKARFNIKKGAFITDYKADIPNLDALYFATQRHMKGKAIVIGELSKAKDLDFSAHSNLFGGAIDATLHNDDFHADMSKLNTLGMLKMLIYPEIFDATLNGALDYNLLRKAGKMDAKLTQGHFTKNQMLDLIKQYGRVDMYVETFITTVHSDIKKEKIYTDLDMRSNVSSIIGKKIYLNSKTKQVDAKLDINANNNPIKVHLSGNVTQPKVQVDASKLIERELKKEAGKQINNLLKGLF